MSIHAQTIVSNNAYKIDGCHPPSTNALPCISLSLKQYGWKICYSRLCHGFLPLPISTNRSYRRRHCPSETNRFQTKTYILCIYVRICLFTYIFPSVWTHSRGLNSICCGKRGSPFIPHDSPFFFVLLYDSCYYLSLLLVVTSCVPGYPLQIIPRSWCLILVAVGWK